MAFAIDEEFVCCHIARFGFLEVSEFEVTVPNVSLLLSTLSDETTSVVRRDRTEILQHDLYLYYLSSLFGFNSFELYINAG